MNEYGLRFLKPGFARTPALDRAFALGWPEARFIDSAEGLPFAIAGHRLVWSREEAQARLQERFASHLRSDVQSFGPSEALSFARHVIPFGGWNAMFDDAETDVFLLEELVGADVLAGAMTSALEEISANEWRKASSGSHLPFYLLGFVLLRAPAEAAEAIKLRLAAVYDRRRDEAGPLATALDLVLHAAAGARRSNLAPASLLYAEDPELIAGAARAESFARYDRRFAARLAFLGGDAVLTPILDRWYAVGDARAQGFFLGTMGTLGSSLLVPSIREAANASLVRDEAKAWLAEHGAEPPPPRASPGRPREGTTRSFDADEFGFALLPLESAEQLRGEDDHTVLTANLDPISLVPGAAEVHGRTAIVFCRTYRGAYCETDEGMLVTYGVDDETAPEVFAAAESRRWMALATVTVETTLVGLPASLAFADAEADGMVVKLPLARGTYAVEQALLTPESSDEDELPPLLSFRRATS